MTSRPSTMATTRSARSSALAWRAGCPSRRRTGGVSPGRGWLESVGLRGEVSEEVAAFHDDLSRRVEERREQLVELCGHLVAASSENPPGDTRDVAAVVNSFLGSAGVPFEVVAGDEAAPNVLARLE